MLVKGHLTNGLQVTLDVDGHEYLLDQTVEKGGDNTGTTPGGMLVASVVGCKIMVARGYLNHNNIPFERIEAETDSKFKGTTRKRRLNMTVKVTVFGADLNEKQRDFLSRTVATGCPVANIITASDENTIDTVVSVET